MNAITPIRPSLRTTASGFVTWLIKRQLPTYRRRMRELQQTQWWSASELAAYQRDRLHDIATHAWRFVPYYRACFERHGLTPSDFSDLGVLEALPCLSKEDVLEAGATMHSRRFPPGTVRTAHTGGTTGTPMNIRRDIWSIATEHAFLRRQWQWAGIGGSDVCAYLTGRVIVPPDQDSGPLYRYDAVLKELILSTYHLSERVAKSYVDAMRSVGAVALVAYPSSATSLARAMLTRDLRLPLRAVLTSSETLQPEARKLISAAFGCPVYDFYGSAERVCYIHTCEEGTYHVVPEYGVTEFVSTGNSPNRCTVVATGFWNMAMPMFRYALGDVIEPGEGNCSCGRAFPTVRRIVGRAQDYLVTPSGRELGAALLTHLLYGARHIVESQLTQDAPDHVIMSYVPDSMFNESDRQSLLALIQAHLPSELTVELRPVTALPRTRSGKVRPIVNLVQEPNDVSAEP